MIRPKSIKQGSRIAIVSPASIVKEEYIDGAVAYLATRGYEGVVMPHAKGPADGCYAAGFEERLDDLTKAWSDPEIDAVLCARGGYGAAHLLPFIPADVQRENPKWLIGFSDISALHAAEYHIGLQSLHAPMAKHLCEQPDNEATRALFDILEGGKMNYMAENRHPYNILGSAEGTLIGGNLAVLNGLASTPFDILSASVCDGAILFIEDVSEAIYAVERMLWRLYMAGALGRIKGLIVGRFTDYRPSKKFKAMDDMIYSLLARTGIGSIPVVFDFPVGHVDENLPMVHGARVRLEVSESGASLREV